MADRAALVIDIADHHGQLLREKIDIGLAALAMDWELILIFIGEGVWHLIKDSQPTAGKDHRASLGLFDLYGVDGIYADEASLSESDISGQPLRLSVQALDGRKLNDLMRSVDHLL